jgi:transcriptional regulator with XRE-family HTH domain
MYLKRLKDLREDNDYSQNDIAKILKITRPQYSLYETGKRDIPVDLLSILAKLYNTSIDYIVGDTNIFTRYPESKK